MLDPGLGTCNFSKLCRFTSKLTSVARMSCVVTPIFRVAAGCPASLFLGGLGSHELSQLCPLLTASPVRGSSPLMEQGSDQLREVDWEGCGACLLCTRLGEMGLSAQGAQPALLVLSNPGMCQGPQAGRGIKSQCPVLSGDPGSGLAPAIQGDSPRGSSPCVSRVLADPPSILGTCLAAQNLPRLGPAPLSL